MRICFLSACAGTRGAPRSLLETITVLQQRGAECFVILPEDGPLVQELSNRGVPTRIIPYKMWITGPNQKIWKRITRPIFNLKNAFTISKQIKQWNCDLVYTNTVAFGIGGFAARLAGLPHVWHIREFGWEDHGQVFDWGERITGWMIKRLSKLVLVNSRATGRKFEKYLGADRIHHAHQAVRLAMSGESTQVPAAKNFRCVIVGAVQQSKGQDEAIVAIALLKKKGIDIELLIVGDGPDNYRQKLEQLIRMHELQDHVKFIGYAPSAEPYLRASDAVLVCSRCEAFGRVTIEGMLAGKPVIGARSGGTAELIQDGVNGLSYTPGDESALASKIEWLCHNRNEAAKIGATAAPWAAKEYNLERYGEEVWSILSPLIQKPAVQNEPTAVIGKARVA